MHRNFLLASALAALATGCDTAPTDSDATASIQGPGYRNSELWIGPGATAELWIDSPDPELADWELAIVDPEIAALGAVTRVPNATNQIAVPLTAGVFGDTTLMIHDEAGALVDEVPVYVRNPDRIVLAGGCLTVQCVPGPTLRILAGETVDLAYGLAYGVVPIASAAALEIVRDDGDLAALSTDGERITISAPAAAATGQVELGAGPDARLTVEVVAVAAADVTASAGIAEDGATAGAVLSLSPTLRDAAGQPVLVSEFAWRIAGVDSPDRLLSYTYDPAAPPTEIALVVGRSPGQVMATAVIHRAP